MPIAFTILGGAWIFLAVVVVMTFAVIYGLYSRRGSGISQRPYHARYGDAPGAHGPSRMSGRDRPVANYTRGVK